MTFNFRIGDEVTCRAMVTPFLRDARSQAADPQKMVVVGRLYEECVGGVQVHYNVRIYEAGPSGWSEQKLKAAVLKDCYRFGEFELMLYADAIAVQKGGE